MKRVGLALAFLSSAASVAAHATFQDLWVDGTDQKTSCTRVVPNNSPVTDVTSKEVACNVGGSKGVEGVCSAEAGKSMSVEMHQQPNDRSCSTEAIGGNHFGPVMVYMSKVDDATTADGSSEWFKVSEFGYDADNKTWGTDMLNANCGKFTFTIPSKIPEGDYLVRAEAMALHTASQVGGAQLYMTCYQVKLAAGAGGQLPAGVSLPGAYKATDPGIQVDIWGNGFKEYSIPGPPVIDQSFF